MGAFRAVSSAALPIRRILLRPPRYPVAIPSRRLPDIITPEVQRLPQLSVPSRASLHLQSEPPSNAGMCMSPCGQAVHLPVRSVVASDAREHPAVSWLNADSMGRGLAPFPHRKADPTANTTATDASADSLSARIRTSQCVGNVHHCDVLVRSNVEPAQTEQYQQPPERGTPTTSSQELSKNDGIARAKQKGEDENVSELAAQMSMSWPSSAVATPLFAVVPPAVDRLSRKPAAVHSPTCPMHKMTSSATNSSTGEAATGVTRRSRCLRIDEESDSDCEGAHWEETQVGSFFLL